MEPSAVVAAINFNVVSFGIRVHEIGPAATSKHEINLHVCIFQMESMKAHQFTVALSNNTELIRQRFKTN